MRDCAHMFLIRTCDHLVVGMPRGLVMDTGHSFGPYVNIGWDLGISRAPPVSNSQLLLIDKRRQNGILDAC
jgi:hypothetical protein